MLVRREIPTAAVYMLPLSVFSCYH